MQLMVSGPSLGQFFFVHLRHRVSAAALVLFILLVGCSVGGRHTSDYRLERTFFEHEAEFGALLTDVRSDSRIMTLQPHLLIYGGQRVNVFGGLLSDVEHAGLAVSRWRGYLAEFRHLGLEGGVLKGRGRVEFRVDSGSLRNGDSYKGYEFDDMPPPHTRTTLDNCSLADMDRDEFGNWIARKHVKGKWYLYLFVNR
jgi:hypothetical protein